MHASAEQQFETAAHGFYPFLNELARAKTTRELGRSELYRKLKPEIDGVLRRVWHDGLAATPHPDAGRKSIQAIAWNIERGMRAGAVAHLLGEHGALKGADIL